MTERRKRSKPRAIVTPPFYTWTGGIIGFLICLGVSLYLSISTFPGSASVLSYTGAAYYRPHGTASWQLLSGLASPLTGGSVATNFTGSLHLHAGSWSAVLKENSLLSWQRNELRLIRGHVSIDFDSDGTVDVGDTRFKIAAAGASLWLQRHPDQEQVRTFVRYGDVKMHERGGEPEALNPSPEVQVFRAGPVEDEIPNADFHQVRSVALSSIPPSGRVLDAQKLLAALANPVLRGERTTNNDLITTTPEASVANLHAPKPSATADSSAQAAKTRAVKADQIVVNLTAPKLAIGLDITLWTSSTIKNTPPYALRYQTNRAVRTAKNQGHAEVYLEAGSGPMMTRIPLDATASGLVPLPPAVIYKYGKVRGKARVLSVRTVVMPRGGKLHAGPIHRIRFESIENYASLSTPVTVQLSRYRWRQAGSWFRGARPGKSGFRLILRRAADLRKIVPLIAGAGRFAIIANGKLSGPGVYFSKRGNLVAKLLGSAALRTIKGLRRVLKADMAYREKSVSSDSDSVFVLVGGKVKKISKTLVEQNGAAASFVQQSAQGVFSRPIEVLDLR